MRRVILRIATTFDRCVVARHGQTTWVWVRGGHDDLPTQLAQLDALLRPDEVALIRAAYGWREGGEADVRATPADYIPSALSA